MFISTNTPIGANAATISLLNTSDIVDPINDNNLGIVTALQETVEREDAFLGLPEDCQCVQGALQPIRPVQVVTADDHERVHVVHQDAEQTRVVAGLTH